MQPINRATISRLVLVGCMVALAVWVALGSSSPKGSATLQDVAEVPQGQTQGLLPQAEPTEEPPMPEITPTLVVRTGTPTPANLQPAVLVTHTMSMASIAPGALQPAQTTLNRIEAIHSMAWAPTGDKFLYVTNSGKLYWSKTDGTNATLLHQYEPDMTFLMLEDQQPRSNTLLLRHAGPDQGMVRGPGHMDVVRFSPGQSPTIEEVHETEPVFRIRWWSSDRASGIASSEYIGGEKLVTLDANGHKVEERNIPYMVAGAVSPGGQWLAYATGQQSTDVPLYGSDPETVYLLNLATGERKQITASGQGIAGPLTVHSWSPDGNWFLIGASIDNALRGTLVRADGQEWITITPPGYGPVDAVWSPDSKRLAWSTQSSGAGDDPHSPSRPISSQIYIVDIPSRKVAASDSKDLGANLVGLMMQPKWSPDGSQLAFLSYDPHCSLLCSELAPAIYLLPGK